MRTSRSLTVTFLAEGRKAFSVGHRRKWRGGEYEKQADGSWKKVAELKAVPKGSPKPEFFKGDVDALAGTAMPPAKASIKQATPATAQGNNIGTNSSPVGVTGEVPLNPATTHAEMHSAPQVGTPKKLGGGMNASELVTFKAKDGSTFKGVFKSVEGEVGFYKDPVTKKTFPVRSNIKAGSYWKREVLSYTVAKELGMEDLVPETVAREVESDKGPRFGSVQLFVPTNSPKGEWDKASAAHEKEPWIHLNKEDAERMRVFDWVTGNTDRHGANILFSGEGENLKPVLIDNGLSFPEGPPDRFLQTVFAFNAHEGELSERTKKLIKDMDPKKIAAHVHEAGLDENATRHTLFRVFRLKEEPSLMEWDGYEGKTQRYIREAEYDLSEESLDAIQAIMVDLKKNNN